MSNHRNAILSVVLGLSSGVLGTYLANRFAGNPPAAGTTQALATASATPTASNGAQWLAEMSRAHQLAAQQAQNQTEEPEDESGLTPPPVARARTVAEAQAEEIEHWQDKLAEHQAESVDPVWSRVATKDFEVDVANIASERGYKLLGVECKSTTCSAQLEWPSYDEAVEKYADLLHAATYKQHCVRDVLLPPPEDTKKPYQGTVLYDCEKPAGS